MNDQIYLDVAVMVLKRAEVRGAAVPMHSEGDVFQVQVNDVRLV